MPTPRFGRLRAIATPRRALAGVVVASLASTGVLLGISSASAVPTVIGDGVTIAPASGTDSTLFSLTVPNAACPSGTIYTQFALNGPGIVNDATQPGGYGIGGGATGTTGLQEAVGLTIANIRTVNAGSFAASGTYTFAFQCWDAAFVAPTDEYLTTLTYTAGGEGSFTTTSTGVTPTPSTTPPSTTSSTPPSSTPSSTSPTSGTSSTTPSSARVTSATTTAPSSSVPTTRPTSSTGAANTLANTGGQGGELIGTAVLFLAAGAALILIAADRRREPGRRQG